MTIEAIDREQASRLVDLAWKEYADWTGRPVQQTPELRQAMLWLAWQACKIEREAQEEARKLAVEAEREACAKICEQGEGTGHITKVQDFGSLHALLDALAARIRARGQE